MRALRRKYLAPFLLIAAIAFPVATSLAPGVSHASVGACPLGTNWDHVTHTCH
jgi:hypothetical protein